VTDTAAPATAGLYPEARGRAWPRDLRRAGAAGAASAAGEGVGGMGPPGGAGGGSVCVIARRVLIAGVISAGGGQGTDERDGQAPTPHSTYLLLSYPSDGGSGGGVFIRADALQFTGAISVTGGDPGSGRPENASASPGAPGAVTLLADALYAPPGDLPVAGTGLAGRTLPVDPVPPPADPGARDFPATLHSLAGPFLAYWLAHGGLAALGAPQTEPFVEGRQTVQYTERALLQFDGRTISLAPLGRLLTQGRSFARVAPFASTATRRYVAASGHSLSGAFLAYYDAHDGAATLGAPLSEVIAEGNGDGSGHRYRLQWFEYGCLEDHAEARGTPYEMQFGLLGVQALERRGWLP